MKLPFTIEQFFRVFEKYNSVVYPFQVAILFFGVFSLLLLHSSYSYKHKIIGGYLGFVWIWTGLVYHILFFTMINTAAYLFGSTFILQGLLILATSFSRNSFVFLVERRVKDYTGYFFVLFALIVYPLISYAVKGDPEKIISIGLPCPSTILTFGFFLLTHKKIPGYLLIIPSLWSLIGMSAAINFGVYQDFMMPIAAIVAIVWLIVEKRSAVSKSRTTGFAKTQTTNHLMS